MSGFRKNLFHKKRVLVVVPRELCQPRVMDDILDYIHVRRGSLGDKKMTPPPAAQKHFVFDLDETLGSFCELHLLWKNWSTNLSVDDEVVDSDSSVQCLTKLLRLFPEFLRSGIIEVLQFLHAKKRRRKFRHFYIYTNNQCGRYWAESLVKAIEVVAGTPELVDQVICAFKIEDRVIEPRRTTHAKTWTDFVRCSMLPPSSYICFIDDTYFPKMDQDRVFYVQPSPYVHTLSRAVIAHRVLMSRSFYGISPSLLEQWIHDSSTCSSTSSSPHPDRNRLLYYIQEFFNLIALRRPSTRKVRGRFWYHLSQKRR